MSKTSEPISLADVCVYCARPADTVGATVELDTYSIILEFGICDVCLPDIRGATRDSVVDVAIRRVVMHECYHRKARQRNDRIC